MAELAFNLNGERFDVPSTAAWWRVRRLRDVPRGGPEVVFARDGLPLIISIDAGIDELRRSVDDVPGKYRLDPVDERHQPVPDVPAAYLNIGKYAERNGATPAPPPIEPSKVDPRDELLRDVVRVNADVTKTMADRFAGVMEAAATLLRAADGAGLPARPGMAIVERYDDEDEDEDEDEGEEASEEARAPRFDIGALLGQFMPILCALGGTGGLDLSKVGSMFGVPTRTKQLPKASSAAAQPTPMGATDAGARRPDVEPLRATSSRPGSASRSGHRDQDAEAVDTDGDTAAAPNAVDTMARFLEIQAALTPAERAFVGGVISDLSPDELDAWRAQLSEASVDEAVQMIRTEIEKAKELAANKPKEDAA